METKLKDAARQSVAEKDPRTVKPIARPGQSVDSSAAETLLAPSVQAGRTIQELSVADLDVNYYIGQLRTQIDAVHGGDMGRAEAMLITQAHTLDQLFNTLTRQAALNMGEYMGAAETYFKLALKAQSQCRTTLETLSAIKNPPVVYAKQANIAQGHQQINNGVERVRTREAEKPENELMEVSDGERLDFGTQGTAGGADSAMETMGAINRAKD